MDETVRKLLEKHKDDKDLTTEKDYIKPGWDWSNAVLEGWNLSGIRFSLSRKPADFSGTNFSNANLRKSVLCGANLTGVNFTKTGLYQTNLSRANLTGANLENNQLFDAKFTGANLSGLNLSKIKKFEARFTKVDLKNANLSDAELMDANFSEVNLVNANLTNADLYNANFTKTNLSGANLSGACLMDADLIESNCSNAVFSGVDLFNTNLIEVNFSGADFSHTDLHGIDFSNCQMRGVNLYSCELSQSNLSGVNLDDSILSDSYLHSAILKGASIRHAELKNTNLIYADLRECNLSESDITGANIFMCAKDNWIIKRIKCDYIYSDLDGKIRYPENRDFESDEFEKIFSFLPTVEYVFKHGMNWFDPVLMNYVVYNVNKEHPEFGIELLSFDKRGHYPRSIFSVASPDISDKALETISKGYEEALKQAREQIGFLENLVKELSSQPRQQIAGSVNGPVIFAEHHSSVKLDYYIFKLPLQKIENVVKETPAKSFTGASKKHILDVVKGAIGSLAASKLTTIVAALNKVLSLQPYLSPDVAIQVSEQFNFIKQYLKNTGPLK